MKNSKKFKTTIGLEIHVQLKTKTKMFCRCSNESQDSKPNTNICPICLAMPGTLPVTNKKAVYWTAKTGLALDCTINRQSKFDRKHYFYPDLPKGFQISQYDQPIAKNGQIETNQGEVGINRVHLEEDAGKLIHPKNSQDSLVDLNRAGTPLMEIVTEPDINSPAQAKEFLRLLKFMVIYLNVSDASMEKGQLRVDANISVQKGSSTTNIVEVKNMNSFKAVEQALVYEQNRLCNNFTKSSKKIRKETRGWLAEKRKTVPQREKEEAADYRYFPEPDIPPLRFRKKEIEKIKNSLPTLPNQIRKQFCKLKLTDEDFWSIIKRPKLYQYYISVTKEDKKIDHKELINWLANERINLNIKPKYFAQFIVLREKGELPGPMAKQVLALMTKQLDKSPNDIMKQTGFSAKIGDELEKIIKEVLNKNTSAVEQYQQGKKVSIQFLIGQVMAATRGQANPEQVKNIIKNIIS